MGLREPLLIPFLSLAAGITLAHFHPTSAWAGALVCLVALLFRARLMAIVFACFTAGLAVSAWRALPTPPALNVEDGETAIFTGCVTQPGLASEDRERFVLDLAPNARAQVSLYAREGEAFPALPYGQTIELRGKLRKPRNFQNPGAFDNERYLARQKIYWTISAAAGEVRSTSNPCGNPLRRALFGLRGAALTRLEQLYLDQPQTSALMEALLLGVTTRVDQAWTEDYRRTGTYHALVISGSHIAVITAVLLFFLRVLGVSRGFALFAGVLAAWLYAGVAGFEAPVLRSAAGMTMYGIAALFYRETRILNTLSAIAAIFLIADPESLFDAGFQLSFLAVALIGAFAIPAIKATSGPLGFGLSALDNIRRDAGLPPRVAQFRVELRLLAETLAPLNRRFAFALLSVPIRLAFYVWEIFLTSAFIQIGVALTMIVFFHRLSASGLSANILIVPALSFAVPVGFAAILLNSGALASVAALALRLSQWAAGLHARWEPAWRIPDPPLWLAVLFALAVALAAVRWPSPAPRIAAWCAALVALALLVIHPFAPRFPAGRLELAAIDVGQGDSLLAAFPDGRLMLIDAGGIPQFGRSRKSALDIGEDVVSPWLWTRSVRRLDVVAMTHAHTDHIGGLPAVLRNFRPRELWTGAVSDNPAWNEIRRTAEQLGIRIRTLQRDEPFPWGGATVQVLAPGPDYATAATPGNNDSLVLRLSLGQTSFLLTGDIERRVESDLAFAGLLTPADVLKVGHHGSRTSSTKQLLDAVRPRFAIISAGAGNSYGHPHPAVLKALAEREVRIYRTDQSGLIEMVSDGKTVSAPRP